MSINCIASSFNSLKPKLAEFLSRVSTVSATVFKNAVPAFPPSIAVCKLFLKARVNNSGVIAFITFESLNASFTLSATIASLDTILALFSSVSSPVTIKVPKDCSKMFLTELSRSPTVSPA